jgi:hypothetical protein
VIPGAPAPPEFEALLDICRVRGWGVAPQGDKFEHPVTAITAYYSRIPGLKTAHWYIRHDERGARDLLHLLTTNP